jgi:predicted PurR-regulated permease PerM
MRQSLLTVAMLVVAWLAWMLRDLIILIGFAALLAYALDPIVALVERVALPGRRPMPRAIAAGIVILVLVVIMGWALAGAVPRLAHEVTRFVEAAPGALARLELEVRSFLDSRGWGGLLGAAGDGPGSAASPLLQAVQRWSLSLLGGVFGNLGQLVGLVLLPVLSFYLLADHVAVRSSVLGFLPESLRPNAARVLDAIDPALRAYVRGQSLVCLVMGTVVAFALQLLGFPVVLLLGVVVAIAEIIPFIGFWMTAAIIALAGYSVNPGLALAGVVAYTIINNAIGYFVSPHLLGHTIKMHPFVVTVSILGGGALLGPAGAILAVPGAAVAQALIAELAPRSRKRAS